MDSIYNFIQQIATLNTRADSVNETVASTYYNNPIVAPIVDSFTENRVLNLSRQDIFDEQDTRTKVAKILVWGYPRGMQGGNMRTILNNFDQIVQYCNDYLEFKDSESFYNNLIHTPSVGLSTVSKILYFFNVKFGNNQAVIVDSLVISAFSLFNEFRNLPRISDNMSSYKAAISCINDLKEAINRQHNLSIGSEDIELFLFRLGKKWKANQEHFINYLLQHSELYVSSLLESEEMVLQEIIMGGNDRRHE